jgi:adenylate cyclase
VSPSDSIPRLCDVRYFDVEYFDAELYGRRLRTQALDALRCRVMSASDPGQPGPHLALPVEYERKWLLSGAPARIATVTPVELVQGYLPGTVLVERIRRQTGQNGVEWFRTIKLGKGAARVEVEERTTVALGEALFALTVGKRVAKQRYTVADGVHRWEIDVFSDRALVLAELEFPTANTSVTLPDWLAPLVVRDVTDEPDFSNWALAR